MPNCPSQKSTIFKYGCFRVKVLSKFLNRFSQLFKYPFLYFLLTNPVHSFHSQKRFLSFLT